MTYLIEILYYIKDIDFCKKSLDEFAEKQKELDSWEKPEERSSNSRLLIYYQIELFKLICECILLQLWFCFSVIYLCLV